MTHSSQISEETQVSSAKTPRQIWERAIRHQVTRDIDGWANSFAVDGAMELPFTPEGLPRRLAGRAVIRDTLGPFWERATKMDRKIIGHEHVVVHETHDPEVAVIEFDALGEAAGKPFRVSYVHVVHAREGRIVLLRDYFDTAVLNARIKADAAPGAT
ncbi:MAG TPA: nuclear transport factor 2 family protein [Polyangiaceae bacterium]|nr:nuclear transport factor 2 family protein [Polyangiaceae bacterium]